MNVPLRVASIARTLGVSTAICGMIAVVIWQTAARPPVHLVIAVDGSRSYRAYLPGAIKMTVQMSERLYPSDLMTVYRFARQTEEVHTGPVPDPDELRAVLVKRFAPLPKQDGTFPDTLWSTIAAKFAETKDPFTIAIYSDADNDHGAESMERLKAAAARVARNPRCVCVAIYGVLPQNRATVEEALAPFGDRLHLYDVAESDTGPLMATVEAARFKK